MEIRFETNGEVKISKIILLIILTIVFFVGGILMAGHSSKAKKQCTYKTTAIVSDIRENTDSDDTTTYAPVYNYTYNGDEHTVVRSYYSSNMKLRVGDEVEFYLDPNDPEKYYCPSEKGSKVFSFALFGFGAVCLLFTVLSIKAYREQY